MERRLYRSNKDKIIGGVAGGLGEYFDIDPVIIRIAFVVLTIAGGWGVVAYILCWIIVPMNPAHQPWASSGAAQAPPPGVASEGGAPTGGSTTQARSGNTAGIILVILGVLLLGNNLLPHFDLWDYWPAILIVIGIWLLARAKPRTVPGAQP